MKTKILSAVIAVLLIVVVLQGFVLYKQRGIIAAQEKTIADQAKTIDVKDFEQDWLERNFFCPSGQNPLPPSFCSWPNYGLNPADYGVTKQEVSKDSEPCMQVREPCGPEPRDARKR